MAVSSTFSGKTAIITGGTSGIGLALVHALAARGAHVVAASSDAEKVKRTRAALEASGGEAHQLDVRDRAAFRELVRDVGSARGRVDYLFNNAGIAVLGEARDHTDQDWDDLLDVNLRGVVNGVCAVYPRMIEQGAGHIVNMASLGGIVATPFNSGYTATKFAVRAVSEGLRQEAGDKLRVTVISPGIVQTNFADGVTSAEVKAQLEVTRDRMAMPAVAVARAVAFAIDQSADIDVNEIVIRPTAQA